jgi:hypothetical protein
VCVWGGGGSARCASRQRSVFEPVTVRWALLCCAGACQVAAAARHAATQHTSAQRAAGRPRPRLSWTAAA